MDEHKEKGPGDGESQGPKSNSETTTEGNQSKRVNDASRSKAPTPLFSDAETLAKAGYQLIPLHHWNATRIKKGKVLPIGKTPRDDAWTTRKDYTNAEVIAEARACGHNLGVRLEATDLVVDVDPRNGGDASLVKLVKNTGLDLDACPHVVTGSGGHHYYLKKPADLSTVGKLEGYEGIDFKKVGGQVVAPGSVHPNGKHYEGEFFLVGPHETPAAPDKLLELLTVRFLPKPEGVDDGNRWGEVAPEELATTLEKVPPDDFGEHDKWFMLMCACHHATAGAGRQEFIDWSTEASAYEDHAELVGYRWDSLSKKGSGRPATVAYLYKVLKDYDTEVARVGAEHDFEVYESDEPQLPTIHRSKSGKADTNFLTCLQLVRHANYWLGLKFNEFDRGSYLTAKELPWPVDVGRRVSDDVVRMIRWYLMHVTDVSWGKDDVLEAVLTIVRENSFHPVCDYLAGLRWDGTPRLDSLLVRYAGAADAEYTRAIGAKTLIAAVRRVRQPGCKFDNVIVMESPEQGRGKSTFIKMLAPQEDWFAEPGALNNLESKDAPLALEGKWIIELGEMSVLSKSAVETMKAFVSCATDRVRRPYGRMVEDLPRQCVFIGTTNRNDYLKDPTGNRRFWPVRVGIDGQLDLDALVADRDQLWAEAAAREVAGESLFLPQELWAEAAKQQAGRVEEDPWADTLRAFLDGLPSDDGLGPVGAMSRVHSATLLSHALGIHTSKQTRADTHRLKDVMTSLGWAHKDNIRVDGKQGRGYERKG